MKEAIQLKLFIFKRVTRSIETHLWEGVAGDDVCDDGGGGVVMVEIPMAGVVECDGGADRGMVHRWEEDDGVWNQP